MNQVKYSHNKKILVFEIIFPWKKLLYIKYDIVHTKSVVNNS